MSKQTDLINIPDAITVSGSNVGIGTSSPNLGSHGYGLHIKGATNKDGTLKLDSSTNNYSGILQFTENGTDQWRIAYDGTNNHLEFTESGVADRMVIQDGGNVGIGTSSPSAVFDVRRGDADGKIAEFHQSSGYGFELSSSTSVATITAGYNQAFTFETGTTATERMRIDSSGNLLVGKTTTDFNTAGFRVTDYGAIQPVVAGGATANFNRLTSDGEIVDFRKDGTTVGSIGASGGDLIIGTGDTGIHFHDGVDSLIPWNVSTASYRDAAIDLGTSTYRFKDAYLSGGVYLGGTGSANKLEDYEEGSFNFGVLTGSLGVNSKGKYTKIGNSVTIYAQIDAATDFTTSAAIYLTGLPFVAQSPHTTSHAGQGAVSYADGMGNNVISVVARSGYAQAFFSNLDTDTTTHSDCTRSWNVRFTLSYFTNS